MAVKARLGLVGSGADWLGLVRQYMAVEARHGRAWFGKARRGKARLVMARYGKDRLARA